MSAWAEEQVQTLMALGVRPEDAQASVSWVRSKAPRDADLSTWLPVADLLVDQIDHAAAQDARAAWYQWAPPEYRRLLDAVDEVAGDG